MGCLLFPNTIAFHLSKLYSPNLRGRKLTHNMVLAVELQFMGRHSYHIFQK